MVAAPLGGAFVDETIHVGEDDGCGIEFGASGSQLEPRRFNEGCAATDKWIQDDTVAGGVGVEQLFDELRGELPGPGE